MRDNKNQYINKHDHLIEMNYYKDSPLRITLIYAFFGALWILLSDTIMYTILSDVEMVNRLSIAKGWFYVIITALLIFVLTSSLVKRLNRQGRELLESYKELSDTYNKLEKSQDDINTQYRTLLEYKEKLYKLAYQDHLTMLPNRRLFYHDLSKWESSVEENNSLILMILDVDNFKYINDIHGHDYGDQVIINIASSIDHILTPKMQLYRIGGDEFGIIISDEMDKAAIENFARLIIEDIKQNMFVSSKTFISLSIGIAIYPESSNKVEDIVKFAEVALYKAKDIGKGTYSFFEASLKKVIDEKIFLQDRLKLALHRNEFIIHFQPQIDLTLSKIRGFEALLRWKNDELGFVPPNKFIPIAEETKTIIEIGKWILSKSIEFGAKINRNNNSKYIISVNISVVQWMQEDFVDMIESVLSDYDLPEGLLELEITESILIHSFDKTIEKLLRLKNKGIKVALDDFGTGYSSLNYLKELPISTLKIDKTFIDDIFDKDTKNLQILNAIINLGHTVGLEVIAEGVETEEQMSYLYNNECDSIQGYFYSKPLETNNVQSYIATFKERFDQESKCFTGNVLMG